MQLPFKLQNENAISNKVNKESTEDPNSQIVTLAEQANTHA